ncbi:hypothetical protein Goari_024683, partial [Gossypium aridum]|nr:hypothetical protein [Gossypium aridum]
MEPLLKGPAALDYLMKAFTNCYGSPSEVCSSLPMTMRWLSSVSNCKDEEWGEHQNSVSNLKANDSSSQELLMSITLKTGGSYNSKNSTQIPFVNPNSSNVTGQEQPECKGDKVDVLVRLGLLKLVSGVSGLTPDALPETFMLNFSRLRGVQAEIQKIIVISTSILIFRQILSSEQASDMERTISNCTEQLSEFLNCVEDAGIEGIVDTIIGTSRHGDKVTDDKNLQLRKSMMARMLAKSLQAEDPVFKKVSRAVYLAFRGIVFGGSGTHGRKLAETALRQVGAASLTERVVKEAKVLVVAATVSIGVHGPWYATLI